MKEKIDAIPGDGGWWKEEAARQYLGAAQRLVALGMSEDDAVAFVESLYWAAASCFGS